MRVIYARGESLRGHPLIRVVGSCRACAGKNVLWVVKGLIASFSALGCEHCGSGDVAAKEARKRQGYKVKKTPASVTGVQWKGLGCWGGKEVAKNYPERSRPGDIIA